MSAFTSQRKMGPSRPAAAHDDAAVGGDVERDALDAEIGRREERRRAGKVVERDVERDGRACRRGHRRPRAAVVGRAVAALQGAVEVLLGSRRHDGSRHREGPAHELVDVENVAGARRQTVHHERAVGSVISLRDLSGDVGRAVVERVGDVPGDDVDPVTGFPEESRISAADRALVRGPARPRVEVRQRGRVVEVFHRRHELAGAPRLRGDERVHRFRSACRPAHRSRAPRSLSVEEDRGRVEGSAAPFACVWARLRACPISCVTTPAKPIPSMIVRADARSAQDDPRFQDLGPIVGDALDVGDPEDGGRRNSEVVRENGAVVVVDDVDPASVVGPDDRRDVRGVHVTQADGGEVSRDGRPEARGGDARPLGRGVGDERVGLRVGQDSERAQVRVDRHLAVGPRGQGPRVGDAVHVVVDDDRASRESGRRQPARERRDEDATGRSGLHRPLLPRDARRPVSTQRPWTARRRKLRKASGFKAPLSVASSRLSLSSTSPGSRRTLRNSPVFPVPFAANPGPKVNFPWMSPAVVRSPVCFGLRIQEEEHLLARGVPGEAFGRGHHEPLAVRRRTRLHEPELPERVGVGQRPADRFRDLQRDLGIRDPLIVDAVRDLPDRADDDRVGLAQEIDDVLLHEGQRHGASPGERNPREDQETETERLTSHSFRLGHGHAFPDAAISASRDPTCVGRTGVVAGARRRSSRRGARTRTPAQPRTDWRSLTVVAARLLPRQLVVAVVKLPAARPER